MPARRARRPTPAVIPEPFGGAISTAQVGVLWFDVEMAGVPAHVGGPAAGVNAIEATFPVDRAPCGSSRRS